MVSPTPPPSRARAGSVSLPTVTGGAEGEGHEGEHAAIQPSALSTGSLSQRPSSGLKDGMLRIPGGRFTMGPPPTSDVLKKLPLRTLTVAPFWVDRTEVSVAAYRACVERGPCSRPPRTSPSCTFDLGDPSLPISCISWEAAQVYCLAAHRRLPREVEWEFAARGTTQNIYPWGSGYGCGLAATLSAEGTNRTCSGSHPSPVGTHPAGASPYGVLDLSGNVEEWVSDWYADGASELSPRAGASHVLRGGGWLSAPSLSRTTSRSWGSVREAGPNVGLRCARDD